MSVPQRILLEILESDSKYLVRFHEAIELGFQKEVPGFELLDRLFAVTDVDLEIFHV